MVDINAVIRELERVDDELGGKTFDERPDLLGVRLGMNFNFPFYLKGNFDDVAKHFIDSGDYEMVEKESFRGLDRLFSFNHKPSASYVTVYSYIPPGLAAMHFKEENPGYNVTIMTHAGDAKFLLDICRFIRDSDLPCHIPIDERHARGAQPSHRIQNPKRRI